MNKKISISYTDLNQLSLVPSLDKNYLTSKDKFLQFKNTKNGITYVYWIVLAEYLTLINCIF